MHSKFVSICHTQCEKYVAIYTCFRQTSASMNTLSSIGYLRCFNMITYFTAESFVRCFSFSPVHHIIETNCCRLKIELTHIQVHSNNNNNNNEKSAQRRRKHCVLAVVRRSQKISPAAEFLVYWYPSPNLISWRWSLPLPTNPCW